MTAWYVAAALAALTGLFWLGVWWTLRTFPVAPPMAPFPLPPARFRADDFRAELATAPYTGAVCASATYTGPIVPGTRPRTLDGIHYPGKPGDGWYE